MRAEFNEDEQLVISSMGITEKMALTRWKEQAFADEKGINGHLILRHKMPIITAATNKATKEGKPLYCSFCGKSQYEVENLIAGPSVYICDECIALCNQIVDENRAKAQAK